MSHYSSGYINRQSGYMLSSDFMSALIAIVGKHDAKLFAQKFGTLDGYFINDMFNYEALAIYAYTVAMEWHNTINPLLEAEAPSHAIRVFAEVLNNGLAKLLPYTAAGGRVYRGIKTQHLQVLSEVYSAGNIVHWTAFKSATLREASAFGGNVLFIIRSLSARPLWYVAANYDEYEVLFPTNRHFRVLESEVQLERLFVLLEEIA